MTNSNNSSQKEKELVEKLIQGNEKAFCELYATYKQRLIYFAMKFLKSPEFAEDIFQDTFAVIWQTRKFIDPNTSFSSFLFTIMRNRILNTLRNLDHETQLKDFIFNQAINTHDDIEEHLFSEEFTEQIDAAMKKLTPRQREIFDMSRNQRMSHKEIAEQLGISPNTVQEHISLALKKLRTYLTKHAGPYVNIVILLFLLK